MSEAECNVSKSKDKQWEVKQGCNCWVSRPYDQQRATKSGVSKSKHQRI